MKEKYLQNAEEYSNCFKAIFEDGVDGIDYEKYSHGEKIASKKCHDIFVTLKMQNQLYEIEEFMLHESPYVRYISASHCLFSNPRLAERALEELIELPLSKIRMHALTTLKGWRKIPFTEDRYK